MQRQVQVTGVPERGGRRSCLAGVELAWPNGRMAGEEQIGARRRLAVLLLLLLINMTLDSVCALWVAGPVPVASVCPSQDRHEPWLLERPSGSTPNTQMRADAGADMTKLGHGRGHSRDPNFP